MTPLRSVLAVAGLTVALLGVSTAAQAAPPALPGDEQLLAASCDNAYAISTLFSVSPETGSSTATGANTTEGFCAYQGAYDASTGDYYGVIWDTNSVLVKWDYLTGQSTVVAPILDPSDNPVNSYAMVIDLEGNAYLVQGTALFDLDLTTGLATPLGPITGAAVTGYAFSVDPTTGLLYFLQQDGELLLIDPVAVTATSAGTWTFSDDGQSAWGLAIDSAGTAWVVESPGQSQYSALYSTPLATFGVAPELSGDIVDAATGETFGNWWITVAPAPPAPAALPPTGVDATPVVIAGLLLATAGMVLVSRRRRTA